MCVSFSIGNRLQMRISSTVHCHVFGSFYGIEWADYISEFCAMRFLRWREKGFENDVFPVFYSNIRL